jgi:glycosyltransferase involved in cell wall biosynthesis
MFIIDFIFNTTGGTENQVTKLLWNMDKKKYDMYLLALHNTDWLNQNSNDLGCAVQAFDYNVVKHRDPRNLKCFLEVTRFIRKVKPDIVITFFPTSYIFGVLAARIAGVLIIISTRRDFGLWLDRRILPFLKFANRFVTAIITNATAIAELVAREEDFNPDKIHVIYNGLDMKAFSSTNKNPDDVRASLGIPGDGHVVGLLAGLRPMKHHKTLFCAASHILQKRDDIYYLLIGDGPMRSELERLVKDLKIEEFIHFTGWQKDVRPFLSILDIGVNCSANEGLSNAIMEYMASGIPCIVSEAGGNRELIEHGVNGYTFELDNSMQLAELILDLLDNDALREEFSARSKKKILEEFSMEKMTAAYDTFFVQLANTT